MINCDLYVVLCAVFQATCFSNTAQSSASFPETEWEDKETDAAFHRWAAK